MTGASELRLCCPAHARYVSQIRHALGAFLAALEFDRGACDDVTTAAGEALANAVEHAYANRPLDSECDLELRARLKPSGTLSVDVSDRGTFIRRKPIAGRGFGLRIIRAVATEMNIDTSEGTCIRMRFYGLLRTSKR
jgi:anti-sigma regulatory factor (Ser/Thr protein kinase)